MTLHVLSRRARGLAALMAAAAGASVLVAGPAGAAETRPASTAAQDGEIRDDFNGDGYADLVIGSPGATRTGEAGAGRLIVAYGSSSGIQPSQSVVLTPGQGGMPGEPGDTRLGERVTSGDLDGDGYADLVVISSRPSADRRGNGLVTVLWGGPRGLAYGGTTLSDPAPEPYVPFARDIEVGDFDGDGRQQLAVVGEHYLRVYEDGFSRSGPPPASHALSVVQNAEVHGYVAGLTAGDFTGAGHEDLVVGGANFVAEGGSGWLLLVPGGPDVGTAAERLRYSNSVIGDIDTGDLNGDGYADLVAGEPRSASDDETPDGRLMLQYGGPEGLGGPARLDYGTPGVPGDRQFYDSLGASVAVGDGNGDGYDDVAAGAPGQPVNGLYEAGEVLLLPGSAHGVTAVGTRAINEDTTGVPGMPGDSVRFGTDVALLDVDGTGTADLAVSGPGENFVDERYREGAVWVLRRPRSGALFEAGRLLNARSFGLPYTEPQFGPVLGD